MLGTLVLGDAYVKWYRTPQYYTGSAWRGTKAIDGGGALINQAIHTIDLLQWFMGGVKRVSGLVRTSTHAIESEDLGIATVEFLSGAVGVIEGTTAVQPGFKERLEIHGQKGSVTLEGGFVTSWKVEGCNEADYVDPQPAAVGGTASPAISHERHRRSSPTSSRRSGRAGRPRQRRGRAEGPQDRPGHLRVLGHGPLGGCRRPLKTAHLLRWPAWALAAACPQYASAGVLSGIVPEKSTSSGNSISSVRPQEY